MFPYVQLSFSITVIQQCTFVGQETSVKQNKRMSKGSMSFTAQWVCVSTSSQRCESMRYETAMHSRWPYDGYWGWRRAVLKQPALGRTMYITRATSNSEAFTSFIYRKIQLGETVQLVQLWQSVKKFHISQKKKKTDMKRSNCLVKFINKEHCLTQFETSSTQKTQPPQTADVETLKKALVDVKKRVINLIKTNNPSMALQKLRQQEHSLRTIGEYKTKQNKWQWETKQWRWRWEAAATAYTVYSHQNRKPQIAVKYGFKYNEIKIILV